MDIVEFDTRPGAIDGLVVVTMKQVTDERGTVRELFRRTAFDGARIELGTFNQINVTESRYGAVRGMHAEETTKLVAVAAGEALGVYTDLRPDSPTFGETESHLLVPGIQVLVPSGVANGFQSLSDPCQYVYCFDTEWQPGMAGRACSPLDPTFTVIWPVPIDPDEPTQISMKDRDAPALADVWAELGVTP
jgi:dTDP-4-dehydrorhamnose 3,5-epimerase